MIMKHVYVDLGLPSGTLWATHNFCLRKRRHFTHSQAVEIARDLHCELPSKENFEELINLCKWKWMNLFGKVTGYKVTGPNGNYIFLPAAGYCYCTSLRLRLSGFDGFYWSATRSTNSAAYCLDFHSNNYFISYYCRIFGHSVRLIKHKTV
jgi:hypothetical protein